MKGVIFLENHSAGYSVHESLGYGFADCVEGMQPGDAVTLRVHVEAFSAGNSRVALIVDAVSSAETEGDYDVTVSGAVPRDYPTPIPILEMRHGEKLKYSRLQITSAAEQRMRNWGFIGLAALTFLFVAARLNAR